MYTEFYGLREKPFNLTPSPRFLYLSEGHKESLALLRYGVMDRKGFILLTGEVGTGKTTMVRTLLDSLNHSVKYVLVTNPLLSSQDFTKYLALSIFKKSVNFNSKAHFLLVFEPYLKKALNNHQNFNLIIDEAHKLSFELLEEIRLLSNMETKDDKLINIFLVGQPELNEKLSDPKCRPLLQRISIRHHIPPLNLKETSDYMNTRLKVAGEKKNNHIFSKPAMDAIYHFSSGYPREINILADNALLLGYSKGIKKITPSMVKACYDDLKLDTSSAREGVREKEKRRKEGREAEKPGKGPVKPGVERVESQREKENRGSGELESGVERVESETKTDKRGNGITGKRGTGEPGWGVELAETKKTSHFWKWAAVLFFFIALSLAAVNPHGKRIISRLRTNIISTYNAAMDNITTKPLSAQSQISIENPILPKKNLHTLQLKPSGKIEGKPVEEPIHKSPIIIITEKKSEVAEVQKVPVDKTEDEEVKETGNTVLEQPLGAKPPVQEKKKEPTRIIIVGRGDTLSGLTRRIYGTTGDDIVAMVKKANPDMKNVDKIKPGQRIILPPLSIANHRDSETPPVANRRR